VTRDEGRVKNQESRVREAARCRGFRFQSGSHLTPDI
jgi:hypothetical protein